MMKIKPVVLGTIAACFLVSNAVLDAALALNFPPTGGRGAPSRTVGGGMRGSACANQKTPLTALVPGDRVNTLVGNKAVVFVYVPAVKAQAELFVQDDRQQPVYETTLNLNGKAGILQLPLPETLTLQPNKDYRWEFSIICDAQDRAKDQITQGVIRRLEASPALQSALKKAPPIKQAELYAQARIWQETLLIASELRRSNPAAWEQLLDSVGLKSIAKAPFVGR